MDEVRAAHQDACPACGAKAVWNPTLLTLTCPYCGTEAPGALDDATGEIHEIDLVTTLRDMPDELRGWDAQKRSVRCRSCKAVSVFDPERAGQNCDFCGSPEIVDYEEIKSPLRPQSVLPFRVDETRVRESIRKWYGSKWLAPGKLKKGALLDTVRGIYLPYWTFDAHVDCTWRADSGRYYYTTETYRDSEGNTRTRQVQHVRWTPVSGRLSHFFDDEPVPASRGVAAHHLKAVEPFPTNDLVPYDTAFLSGFVVEHYQVVLFDAYQTAEATMGQKLRELCAQQIEGDTYRGLRVNADFGRQTFKHILVPVWILHYDFGRKSYQVVVNGYTGTMSGDYPKSTIKVVLLVMAITLIVGLVVILAQSQG